MNMAREYTADAPSRAEVDKLPGLTLLEFGTGWCGYCRAAQPAIEKALDDAPALRHLKVEDGKGRLLGRSFRVTLWPTLIVLRDGVEQARVVRPARPEEISDALARARDA